MRIWISCALALLGFSPTLEAQAKPSPEIGIRAGWLRFSGESSNAVSIISLPASPTLGNNAVYFTIFAADRLAIEPQVGFSRTSSGDNDSHTFSLAAQLMGFFGPDANHAPYIFVNGALNLTGANGSSADSEAIGGGLGYRSVVNSRLGLRAEGRYRRWFGEGDFSLNEFGILVGFGVVLR